MACVALVIALSIMVLLAKLLLLAMIASTGSLAVVMPAVEAINLDGLCCLPGSEELAELAVVLLLQIQESLAHAITLLHKFVHLLLGGFLTLLQFLATVLFHYGLALGMVFFHESLEGFLVLLLNALQKHGLGVVLATLLVHHSALCTLALFRITALGVLSTYVECQCSKQKNKQFLHNTLNVEISG